MNSSIGRFLSGISGGAEPIERGTVRTCPAVAVDVVPVDGSPEPVQG